MHDNSLLGIFEGKPIKPNLLLVSYDENSIQEIHELVIIEHLLRDNIQSLPYFREIQAEKVSQNQREIDRESKIVQVETHRQNDKPVDAVSPIGSCDIFIVYKTTSENRDIWWSLEKLANQVIVQRSRDKDSVKTKLKGETRQRTELITQGLEGKGCMRELLRLLWIYTIIDFKYQRDLSRCESLIPFIMTKMTKVRYEYNKDFTYSALSSEERNPDLSDLIHFLSTVANWHPLVVATYLGDTWLLDRVQQGGRYGINDIYNGFTLLNLAILFCQTEMVDHLLDKLEADPMRCDEKGRNALHTAAKFNRHKKIVDSLVTRKVAIDQCDATGSTALHHAVTASNTAVVRCLLDNGADAKRLDQYGRSSLHVAAFYATDKIVSLLLQKKETAFIDACDKSGVTALHNAAMASNVTTARHLLSMGPNVNCRDKRELTPLHVAAFFAKDMDLIDLFLDNKKVNLHCCDKLGQNVVAYARKNTYGLSREIIRRVREKDHGVIKEYELLKEAKSDLPTSCWKRLVWNGHDYLSAAGTWLRPITALLAPSPARENDKLKVFYVPYADLRPGKGNRISELAFIRYIADKKSVKQPAAESEMLNPKLLSDIDHCSNITRVQIYTSSNNSASNLMSILRRTFQKFIVFKTISQRDGEHWWSLDVNTDYIALQRSREISAVKNKFGGKERKDLTQIIDNLEGRGSIKDLFTMLWIHQVMAGKDENQNASHPSLVTFVCKQITAKGYECDLAQQRDGNLVNWDLIHVLLSGTSKWHPLFVPIYLENAKLFDKIKETTRFEHFNNKLSPLNLAIAFPNKAAMVRHILERLTADPALVEGSRWNELHFAVATLKGDDEISKLLSEKKKVKIDGCDKFGRTALHFAAASSNVALAKYLIKNGATPNLLDNNDLSPLHLAAIHSTTEMIDLLWEAEENNLGNMGIHFDHRTCHGMTALHCAAIASNETTAKHLIKRGAQVNKRDRLGHTPLHLAAFFAKDIKIVDVLLNDKQVDVHSLDNSGQNALYYAECNQHGLSEKIASRLQERGTTKRRSSNNTTALDLTIQYSNQEVSQFLHPERRKSDGAERKKQLHDTHRAASQTKGSQPQSIATTKIFSKILAMIFYFILNFVIEKLGLQPRFHATKFHLYDSMYVGVISKNFLHSFQFIARLIYWLTSKAHIIKLTKTPNIR